MSGSEPQIVRPVASSLYGLRYTGSRLKQENALIHGINITAELIRLTL
jgi:hypothetical protein